MPIATSRSLSFLAEQAHADPGHHGEADEPGERRKAEQRRAGRAGETDVAERVAGEGLAAQHQEIADRARQDRRDAGGREGGAHEVVFKHGRATSPLPLRERAGGEGVRAEARRVRGAGARPLIRPFGPPAPAGEKGQRPHACSCPCSCECAPSSCRCASRSTSTPPAITKTAILTRTTSISAP